MTDRRTIGVLAWFPRPLNASDEERQRVELSRLGLHWEHLDEDISVAGFLARQGDMTWKPERANPRKVHVPRSPQGTIGLARGRVHRPVDKL